MSILERQIRLRADQSEGRLVGHKLKAAARTPRVPSLLFEEKQAETIDRDTIYNLGGVRCENLSPFFLTPLS